MDELVHSLCRLTIVGGTRDGGKFSWLVEQVRAGVFGDAFVVFTSPVPDALSPVLPPYRATVLAQGCACCGGNAGLIASLRDILRKNPTHLEPFDRIVLEVGNEADIGAIAASVETDAILSRQLKLSEIVVALAGTEDPELFEDQPELVRQVEAADCVVVTRPDRPMAGFEAALERLKPGIAVYGGQDA